MNWMIGLVAASLVFSPAGGHAQSASSTRKAARAHASTASSHAQSRAKPGTAKAGRTSAFKTSAGKSGTARGRRRGKPRAAAPVLQAHPDAERYQQIQQALSERGYFKGTVNGDWGADSQEALARFQTDQKLGDADGKITSLTLRGLGLGPKHELSSAPPPSTGAAKGDIPSLNSPQSEPALPPPPVEDGAPDQPEPDR